MTETLPILFTFTAGGERRPVANLADLRRIVKQRNARPVCPSKEECRRLLTGDAPAPVQKPAGPTPPPAAVGPHCWLKEGENYKPSILASCPPWIFGDYLTVGTFMHVLLDPYYPERLCEGHAFTRWAKENGKGDLWKECPFKSWPVSLLKEWAHGRVVRGVTIDADRFDNLIAEADLHRYEADERWRRQAAAMGIDLPPRSA
jgi:hypothetical protein